MSFFNKSKLKIKSETVANNIIYYIDYHNYKPRDFFTLNLLSELSQSEKLLMVIDTKMAARTNEKNSEIINTLLLTLEKHSLNYRVLKVARESKMSIFGSNLNTSDKKKSMDTIIGAVVNLDNLKDIKELLNDYFVYYYSVSSPVLSEMEILDHFEGNFHNDRLKDFFTYHILDSNFLTQLVINTNTNNSEYLLKVITAFDSSI